MELTPLEELLVRLIAVDSTTGREQEYAELVEALLITRGYEVERQPVIDGRFNLAANAQGRRLLFNTHLDTVPPYFEARVDADAIYGRGACDTKGLVAAMLFAGDRLRADGHDDFGYLFVVGEEVNGAGAKAANERYRAEHVLVGEPTERKLAVGHKGVAKFRLSVQGKAGHSAYPDTGRSAIHELNALLAELLAADCGHDDLLGRATLNVGEWGGGRAANVIADEAWAVCMLRSVEDKDFAQARVEGLVGGRAKIEWLAQKDPGRMGSIEGFPTTVVGFSSDIPYMPAVGKPYLYGAGSILDAHTAREHIRRDDLALAVDDYVRIAKTLLD